MIRLLQRTLLAALCGAVLLAAAGCRHATPTTFQPDPSLDYSLGWFHEVEHGETLASIGAYYGRSVPLLAKVNDLEPPYALHEKMHLYIPPDNSEAILTNPVMTLDRIRLARAYHDQRSGLPDESDGVPRKFAQQIKTTTAHLPPPKPDPGPADARFSVAKQSGPKTKVPTADEIAAARTSARVSGSANALKTSAVAGSAARPQLLTVAPPRKMRRPLLMPLNADFRVARPFVADGLTTAHMGIDMACPSGTPILAAADGVVLNSSEFGSYGNMVLIDHGDGFASLYGHNSVNIVREGDRVKAGQVIARVGATGRATGPHLHFELRYNGIALDPEPYLPTSALAGRTLASSKTGKNGK